MMIELDMLIVRFQPEIFLRHFQFEVKSSLCTLSPVQPLDILVDRIYVDEREIDEVRLHSLRQMDIFVEVMRKENKSSSQAIIFHLNGTLVRKFFRLIEVADEQLNERIGKGRDAARIDLFRMQIDL